MTLRDLSPDQVTAFQRECTRRFEEKQSLRSPDKKLNEIDFKLAFSDGMKAVLARISQLPE